MIQKYQSSVTPDITQALASPIVSQSSREQIISILATCIPKAYADLGVKPNEIDVSYLISRLPDELMQKTPTIRINEIPIAVENGIRREYGEFFGLNLVSISFFVKSYLASESRANAAKGYLLAQAEPSTRIPSPEETWAGIKTNITDAYSQYLQTGSYADIGNFIYLKLDEIGLVNIDSEEKKRIFDQAKADLLSKSNPDLSVNRTEFRELSKKWAKLSDKEAGKSLIQTEARKIALRRVFENMKAENTTVESLRAILDSKQLTNFNL